MGYRDTGFIEQRTSFDHIKVPRKIIELIRNNFTHKGNKYIFIYVFLLSQTFSDYKCRPIADVKGRRNLSRLLNIKIDEVDAALSTLFKLNLIDIHDQDIIITDEEALKYNKKFRNENIKVGIKTNRGFFFVPKNSIATIKSNNKESLCSSSDVVIDIFMKLLFSDEKIPKANQKGYAMACFDYGCKTNYKILADTYHKSKSTMHDIAAKCRELEIFEIISCADFKKGSYVISRNYMDNLKTR